jgi:hypothetical protein
LIGTLAEEGGRAGSQQRFLLILTCATALPSSSTATEEEAYKTLAPNGDLNQLAAGATNELNDLVADGWEVAGDLVGGLLAFCHSELSDYQRGGCRG